MIKILELFGGIGSPRKALENLGINVKTIDYVEWWDHAVKTYNLLFDNNYNSQDVKTWNMFVDICIHGSPCQDFSVAGKNDLSSGRSILYKRTLEIIKKELHPKPKFVIWENVKGLLSKKNYPHFQHYLNTMEEIGYRNYYKILNSKDFGIPQSRNRVFVVSVRSDLNFQFDFDNLKTTEMLALKNFLDKDVDISYYITQKSMTKAIENGRIKIIDNIVETITTKQMRWNNSGAVKIPLRNYLSYQNILNPENGVAPTLTSNHGETPFKVAIKLKSNFEFNESGYAKISLGSKEFNSTDFIHNIENEMHTIGSNSANNRVAIPIKNTRTGKYEINTNDFKQESNVFMTNNKNTYIDTLTTNKKSCKIATPILMVNENYDYRMSDGSKRPIGKINKEGNITIPLSNNHTANKIGVNVVTTLTTQNSSAKIAELILEKPIPGVPIFIIDGKPYHLRILTQRECWRLMGWKDIDIDKIIHLPKTHLYHMAGNAIVIPVLEVIFKSIVEYLENKQNYEQN
ncbi:DNA cytosine methyltransferase [Spiroplasma endosymbiont of Labia minor]|uniref:DNA cytosine methyltransferase n=1 Tax=Spiroplasma endosymbiont of Labia minor TaxID=3066305 RepID=UPI0030D4D58E